MIPRLKPYYNHKEILAALKFYKRNSVDKYEREFAKLFNAKYAISFPYGRSAFYALIKSLNLQNAEIIMPAYTCVVVAHAIVLSGNIPRFIDISLHDYNMDLDQLSNKITKNTKAIIVTHLFGYPLNIEKLNEIVSNAEKKIGYKIWIIHDCAHSFGAEYKNQLVCNHGDATIFGLNMSKVISSIFGGMITTNNPELSERIKKFYNESQNKPSISKSFKRLVYLLSTYAAFNQKMYSLINYLEEETSLINSLTDYYDETIIDFPIDYLDKMLDIEARVGIEQLKKYLEIIIKRKEIASFYFDQLKGIEDIILPPRIDGATYSHYVPRISDRKKILHMMRKQGIQLGWLIEYSIPEMSAYRKWKDGKFPNSYNCSKHTINLPNWPGLTKTKLEIIVNSLKSLIS